ncbi:MAG TPA: hypothetical protein VIM03_02185, partial [Thermoleophilaceae bacterium]
TLRDTGTFDEAARACGVLGRRLPGPDELSSFSQEPGIELANVGELTSARIGSKVDTIDDIPTHAEGTATSSHPYRCEAPLSN